MSWLNRRQPLLRSSAAVLAARGPPTASPPVVANRVDAPRAKKPNVVFVVADDLGYADLSCFGRRDYATSPEEPAHPFDGMNLLAAIVDRTAPVPRKLHWRYKNHSQKAVLEGSWKYLEIADRKLLFDVVRDPLERANLKDRHADVIARLAADYAAWNATMLPLDPQSTSWAFNGADIADHYGVEPPPSH